MILTKSSPNKRRPAARRLWLTLCALVPLLVAFSQVSVAYADPGDLDPTFSGDGLQTTDFFGYDDVARGVDVQADGKIVVAGYASNTVSHYLFALARYNATGTLDTSFGGDGKVTVNFPGGDYDEAYAVAIQSNGKIVTAGFAEVASGDFAFAVTRHNSDGSLDTTFSGDGLVTTNIVAGGLDDRAYDLAIQPDGKIVVAGEVYFGSSNDFALVRYNSDGSLDTTFNSDGIVRTTFGGEDTAWGVAIQADGKIVAVGETDVSGSEEFALARYETDGSLDTTFSDDGKVTLDISVGGDYAQDCAVQTDGKIVVSGSASDASEFALARLNSSGDIDTTFGTNGTVTTDLYSYDVAREVLLQADGKIVAAGSGSDRGGFAMFIQLARYDSSGDLDPDFGDLGTVQTRYYFGWGAELQADEKIVVAGFYEDSFGLRDFAVARYDNDPPVTPTSTRTATRTSTRTATASMTRTPTRTATGIATRTVTPFPTSTVAGTSTVVGTGTAIRTATHVPTGVATQTQPATPTRPSTSTRMPTHTATHAATGVPTQPSTPTRPATFTPAPTRTAPATPTSGGPTATPGGCTPHTYSDVPPDHTFYTFVTCLSYRGVIGGYGDCTFRPGNDITRGQIAKVVSNAAGYNDDVTGRQTFTDVPNTDTFWLWIERLSLRGVMGGYACGGPGEPCDPLNRPYFRPANNATRGQVSKIVANAAGLSDPETGLFYTDVPPSHTFYLEIMRLTRRGVMSGYLCGGINPQTGAPEPCDPQNRPYYRPGNNVTRGQASKIVANTFFPGCPIP